MAGKVTQRRVAIDLRMVTGHPHGIARYALALWQGLPANDEIQYVALCNRRGRDAIQPLRLGDDQLLVNSPFLSPLEQLELPARLSGGRIDLFHATSFSVPVLWRGPLVLTLHDAIHLSMPSLAGFGRAHYHRWIVGPAARRAIKILTVSQHAAEEIAHWYRLPRDRIAVAPDAATLSPLEAVERKHLLYVGNGKPHKNVGLLVEMQRRIPRPPPLMLCGEGLGHCVGPGIFWRPSVTDEELSRLYAEALLFLFPSRCEGFGLPPLEAALLGAPLVLADGSALREIWNEAAILLPWDRPELWAASVSTLLEDAEARRTLSIRCQQRAQRYRSWQPAIALALESYKEGLALTR